MSRESIAAIVSFEAMAAAIAAAGVVDETAVLRPHLRLQEDLGLDSFEMFRLYVLVGSALPVEYEGWDEFEDAMFGAETLGEVHDLLNDQLGKAHAAGWLA